MREGEKLNLPNGKAAQIGAYSISGCNHAKIRDSGRAMDFSMEYEIKDTTRRDSNVFAERPLPPLPTPKCDWSAFPKPEWQPPIVKHYHDKHGDDLLARNVYEVQRMVYTIYNAIGADPHNLPFPADFGVTIGQRILPHHSRYVYGYIGHWWSNRKCNLSNNIAKTIRKVSFWTVFGAPNAI